VSAHSTAGRRSRQTLLLALWLGLTALLILGSFLARSESTTSSEQLIYEWSTFGGGLVQEALFAGFAFAIATALPPVRTTLGLRRFSGRYVWLAFGVVVAAAALSAALEPVLHAGREQGLTPTTYEPGRLAPLLANSILFALIGPLSEELLFRGLGVTALSLLGRTVAIGGSAVVFGLAHGIPTALPVLVFLGVGLAWIRERSGSVWPGYFAHATYNAIGIAVAVGQAVS
jgi:membrane protease YdiL (CAAX protease family)